MLLFATPLASASRPIDSPSSPSMVARRAACSTIRARARSPGARVCLAVLPCSSAIGSRSLRLPFQARRTIVLKAVFDQLAVADGTRLLDIACGSGFAAHLASERGAVVSGIDASEGLVTIAHARTPNGDFRVGDMFA